MNSSCVIMSAQLKPTAVIFCTVSLALLSLSGLAAGIDLVQSGGYGIDDIRMTNSALELLISPENGARIISLRGRTDNTDYVFYENAAGGIMHGMQDAENYPGEMRDARFKYELLAQHPLRISVRFFHTIGKGEASGVEFSKTITLYENIPAVFVKLELKNNSFLKKRVALRMHNWVKIGADDDAVNTRTVIPTANGPVEIDRISNNQWQSEFPYAWMARMDRQQQCGLAFHFNYDAAEKMLSYQPQTPGMGATCEWTYRPVVLEHGEAWQTDVRILPFAGLRKVSHVSAEQVYELNASPEQGTLKIYSVRDRDISATLSQAGARHVNATGLLAAGELCEVAFPTNNQPWHNNRAYDISVRAHGYLNEFQTAVDTETFTDRIEIPAQKNLQISAGGTGKIKIRKPTDTRKEKVEGPNKILVLATWWFNNSSWSRDFPELLKLSEATKHSYEWLFCRTEYTKRWAFRSREIVNWLLQDDARFSVDLAFEEDYGLYLENLYDYDVLVLNDFPGIAVLPYLAEIEDYIRRGGRLLVLGGYAAFGGRGNDYGNYASIERLLPVQISASPDWVSQTAYPDGEPGWGGGCERNVKLPGMPKTMSRCGPVLNIHKSMAWLADGEQSRNRKNHPVTAGIPLHTISPGYHAVKAKAGSTSIATIAEYDVVSSMQIGTGKVLAVAISDPRRLYFWEYTGKLVTQALEWLCDLTPEILIYKATAYDNSLEVELGNSSSESAAAVLRVAVHGEDGNLYLEQQAETVLQPESSRTMEFALNKDLLPPGKYSITAESASHRAHDRFSISNEEAIDIHIAAKERRYYLRGEEAEIQVDIDNLPGSAEFRLDAVLVSEKGPVMQVLKPVKASQANSFTISTDHLAYGEYNLCVSLSSGPDQILARHSIPLNICRKKDSAFPVFIYDLIPAPRVWPNTYLSFAVMDRLSEDYNLAFSVRWTDPYSDPSPGVDHALGTGLSLIQFPARCGLELKNAPQGYRDQAANDKLSEKIKTSIGRLAHFPAIYGNQFDDEGTAASRTEFDQEAFRETYGYAMPVAEVGSLKERLDLADYYLNSGTEMWNGVARTAKKINPELKNMILQTVSHTPAVGGWLWDNFRGMDVALIDLYPLDLNAIGNDFLYLNLLRSVQKRLNIPAWVLLGEYRNNFESMKMQYWLALGSGLDGYGWYYTGYSTGTGIFRREWDMLKPYQQIALEYGPLLAKWRKRDSDVAVFYSKAVLTYRDQAFLAGNKSGIFTHYKKYSQTLEKVFEDLYRLDLYADVITEDDVREGSVAEYKVLIVAGAAVMEKDIKEKLGNIGKQQVIMVDTLSKELNVPHTVPLEFDRIAHISPPSTVTPEQAVFTERLQAGEMDYLVVYNHARNDTDAVLHLKTAKAAVIYDILKNENIPFRNKTEDEFTIEVPLKAVDGTILALLPSEITGISLHCPSAASTGKSIRVEVQLDNAEEIRGFTPARFTVIDPSGAQSQYGSNIVLENGRDEITVPFALNDLTGTWEFRVADLISGLEARGQINLEENAPH